MRFWRTVLQHLHAVLDKCRMEWQEGILCSSPPDHLQSILRAPPADSQTRDVVIDWLSGCSCGRAFSFLPSVQSVWSMHQSVLAGYKINFIYWFLLIYWSGMGKIHLLKSIRICDNWRVNRKIFFHFAARVFKHIIVSFIWLVFL